MNHSSVFAGLIVGLLVGAFLVFSFGDSTDNTNVASPVDTNSLPSIVVDTFAIASDDAVYGDRSSDIVVIEYSDFDCPFCERFHPTMEAFVDDKSNNTAWVYRHNPLPIHPGAYDLSIASECVFSNKGNDVFWEFTNEIFNYGGGLSKIGVIELAKQYGVTQNQINNCFIKGSKEITKVDTHILQASSFGFSGTPNGIIFNKVSGKITSLPGAVGSDKLRELIRSIQ